MDARIAGDLKQSTWLCLHWPDAKWVNQHDKAWRLRSGEKSLSCSEIKPSTAKVGRGLERGEGVLMSLKMFLSITRIQRLPKTLQSTSCLSQSPGNCAVQGTSCSTQFSGASYWASKRGETMSISCKNAELQQFCVVMSTIWVLKVENDERTIGHIGFMLHFSSFRRIILQQRWSWWCRNFLSKLTIKSKSILHRLRSETIIATQFKEMNTALIIERMILNMLAESVF